MTIPTERVVKLLDDAAEEMVGRGDMSDGEIVVNSAIIAIRELLAKEYVPDNAMHAQIQVMVHIHNQWEQDTEYAHGE